MDIRDWQKQIYERNVRKGFYDYKQDIALVRRGLDSGTQFSLEDAMAWNEALERILADYEKATLERKLLLVIGEIVEAHEELRSNHSPTEVYFSDGNKPEGFPVEIADAVIRLLDLQTDEHIDLETEMIRKSDYNEQRPYKHGKAF